MSTSGSKSDSNQKSPFKPKQAILESLRDIGTDTANTMKDSSFKDMPNDFMDQILARKPVKRSFSGEISAGEQLMVNDLYSGKYEEERAIKKQLFFERNLLAEERVLVERKSNELKIQLTQIMQEIQAIAVTLPQTAEEVKAAQMQSVVDPGQYHVTFLESILTFLKSFRRKIENANIWFAAANHRAQKKTFWGMYKKHGGKFLLSGEHYSQRSAG